MAWANQVSAQDVQALQVGSESEKKESYTLEDFKADTSKFDLPEHSAELIYARNNLASNGLSPYQSGELDSADFDDAVEDAKVFEDMKSEIGFMMIGETASTILTSDTDGRMDPKNVEALIEEGYLEVEDLHGETSLIATDKGEDLLSYMLNEGDMLASDKHVVDHVKDFEARSEKTSLETQESNTADNLSQKYVDVLVDNGLMLDKEWMD